MTTDERDDVIAECMFEKMAEAQDSEEKIYQIGRRDGFHEAEESNTKLARENARMKEQFANMNKRLNSVLDARIKKAAANPMVYPIGDYLRELKIELLTAITIALCEGLQE